MHTSTALVIWASVPTCGFLIVVVTLHRFGLPPGGHVRDRRPGLAAVTVVAEVGASALLAMWTGIVLLLVSIASPSAVELAVLLGAISAASLILEAWSAGTGDRFWSPAVAFATIAAALAPYWALWAAYVLFWGGVSLIAVLLLAAAAKFVLPWWWTSRLPSVKVAGRAAAVALVVVALIAAELYIVSDVIIYLTRMAVLWAGSAALMLAGYVLVEERDWRLARALSPPVGGHSVPLAGNVLRVVGFLVPFAVAGAALIPGVLSIAAGVLLAMLTGCVSALAWFHHRPRAER